MTDVIHVSYRAHGGMKGERGLIVLLVLKASPLTHCFTEVFFLNGEPHLGGRVKISVEILY